MLDDKFDEYFSAEFPIFYKNKLKKHNYHGPDDSLDQYFFRSPIDCALKNNQIGSVSNMVKYIIKYQNSFVSHMLFLKNFSEILD